MIFPGVNTPIWGEAAIYCFDARSQIDRDALSAAAEEVIAEGQIGDRNFVPARWQMADHKAIGLAACDGLPIDYVVGLNRNPKSGAAVDYEARRLGGDCARRISLPVGPDVAHPARRVRRIAAAQNFRI